MEPSNKKFSQRLKDKAVHTGTNFKRRKISYLHRLFRNKGSGFYGVGYILTFLYLEISAAISEISEFEFSVEDLAGQIISHLISFSIETLVNFIKATIWPFLVFTQFSDKVGIGIVLGAFVVYYLANKKWNFYDQYQQRFSNDSVNQIILNWEQQNSHFTNCNSIQPLSFNAEGESIETLLKAANNQQLEEWRHQPASCFALVTLLQYQQTLPESNSEYLFQVIVGAIEEKLDSEMTHSQRCFLYLPLYLSSDNKLHKRGRKNYSKLRKTIPKELRDKLDSFIERISV